MSESVSPDPLHGPGPGADSDFDDWTAWLDREIAAGRDPVPPQREPSPGLSISLGEATDVDPELLAAMCGPDGLGGQSPGQQFGQDAAADVLRPGPVLAALAEQVTGDLGRLDDDQLTGVLRASQRLANREAWRQALVIAEFGRRREAQLAAATARGVPVHCRAGEFPGEELAAELRISGCEAAARIDTARQLTARLPATLAALASGLIDARRAAVISDYTASLSDADIAAADEMLAAYAIEKRVEQLARKAAALEMRLAPQAVRARKERERRTSARVEVRREMSGNASLAAREMDTASALASKAHIDAIAARLRTAGIEGTLGALRVRVLAELTQGRDPLGLIRAGTPAAGNSPAGNTPAGDPSAGDPAGPPPASGSAQPQRHCPAQRGSRPPGSRPDPASSPGPGPVTDPDAGPVPDRAPVQALVNLIVPIGTHLGWSTAPAQAGPHGLLDAAETRDITRAAARHPATRWCVTITGSDGTAVAHACARGQHSWLANFVADSRPTTQPGQPGQPTERGQPAHPPPDAGARLALLFRRLNVTFRPITEGDCDHTSAEDQYLPSRGLRHLVRARNATCTAPGCLAQAVHCDVDHTTPHPDGPTCQCNLAPKCRRHHRCKQAPGWRVEQPEPGIMRWTLPSGRRHTTTPTEYGT
ncbi:HNH endonuclease signature motif containing protein [Trebonia kvetii]|nr:HNH endonuclease [Trebonia kvetii]